MGTERESRAHAVHPGRGPATPETSDDAVASSLFGLQQSAGNAAVAGLFGGASPGAASLLRAASAQRVASAQPVQRFATDEEEELLQADDSLGGGPGPAADASSDDAGGPETEWDATDGAESADAGSDWGSDDASSDVDAGDYSGAGGGEGGAVGEVVDAGESAGAEAGAEAATETAGGGAQAMWAGSVVPLVAASHGIVGQDPIDFTASVDLLDQAMAATHSVVDSLRERNPVLSQRAATRSMGIFDLRQVEVTRISAISDEGVRSLSAARYNDAANFTNDLDGN